jgi:hypothetical protein
VNGDFFEISWDAEPNPYLGVWINRGAYQGFQYVAALEPTNGPTDFLSKHNSGRLVPAGGEYFWRMTITLGLQSENKIQLLTKCHKNTPSEASARFHSTAFPTPIGRRVSDPESRRGR